MYEMRQLPAVCPIYKEIKKKSELPAAKLALSKWCLTELDVSPGYADRMSLCTTCMACNEICPCGVRFDKIILAARADAVRNAVYIRLKDHL